MTNHFNQAAQDWDKNPIHLERTEAIVSEFLKLIPIRKEMKALEYGSGTGLMSFALRDHFSEIVLMDSSIEMHKQAVTKVKATASHHLIPLHFDLEHEDYTQGTFDIIFTQMVMHHVQDVPAMIHTFYNLLQPGGYLAIADLFTEDGSFHDSSFIGHFGFDPDYMIDILKDAGFSAPVLQACYEIKRPLDNNIIKAFPVFLVVAVK